jgi:carboxymethylenebutenolidase
MVMDSLHRSLLCEVGISRRMVIRSLLGLAGVVIAGPAWSAVGLSESATPEDLAEDTIQFPSGRATLDAFLVSPKGGGPHPAIVLIHSSAGLAPSVKDFARKLSAEGFIVLAPDFRSRVKSASGTGDRTLVVHLDPALSAEGAKGAYEFLKTNQNIDSAKISTIGLGWGSWRAVMLGEMEPDLHRIVVYYGAIPTDGLEKINTPVLAEFGEYDFRTTGNAVWAQKTFNEKGKSFSYKVYDGANVDFVTDPKTKQDRDAAAESWSETLEFLRSR